MSVHTWNSHRSPEPSWHRGAEKKPKKPSKPYKFRPSGAEALGKACERPGMMFPAGARASPGPASPLGGPGPSQGERESRGGSAGAALGMPREGWNLLPPPSSSSLPASANCRSREQESDSSLPIFNLKMQMLLVSRSAIREPLCQALTSIRGD